MKGKFRILGRIGLGVFMVCALMLAFMPVAPVSAATAVTDVWVEFPAADAAGTADTDYNVASAVGLYRIHFKATTALTRGVDTITVQFPDGVDTTMGPSGNAFTLGSACSTANNFDIDPDAEGIDHSYYNCASASYGGKRLTVTVGWDIAAGSEAYLLIDDASNMVTGGAAHETTPYKVKVHTSKDTTPVLSTGFYLGDAADVVGTTSVTVSPDTAGSTGQYEITFTPTEAHTANTDTITVIFPYGTTVPSSIAASSVQVYGSGDSYSTCGQAPTVDTDLRRVIVTLPVALDTTESKVKFLTTAGIAHPTTAYAYWGFTTTASRVGFIRTSNEPQNVVMDADGYEITYATPTKLDFDYTSTNGYSDKYTMIHMYSSVLYLQVEDAYGNKCTGGAYASADVTLSSSSGTGNFYTGTTTLVTGTQALSSGAVSLRYKDSAAGTHTLTASYSGLTDATWTMTVCPGVSLYDSSNNLINTYAPTSSTPRQENDDYHGGDYINDAITAAMAGDTVKVGDGTYEMDTVITLNKKVTLTSLNGASSTRLEPTTDNLDAINVEVTGTAANPVIIDGLTFDRLRGGVSHTNVEFDQGVYNNAYDYVTVRNCVFNYIQPTYEADNEYGACVGFITYTAGGGGDAAITSGTISNNTFNYCGEVTNWSTGAKSAAINIMAKGGDNAISGVSVSGNTLNNCNGYGMMIKGYGANMTVVVDITNNTLTNCFTPIELTDRCGSSATSVCSITGNTISRGYGHAIIVLGSNNYGVTIKNNTISDTAAIYSRNCALRIDSVPVSSDCHYVQYNSITNTDSGTGYGIYIGSGTVALSTIDCRYNWFGDASGPTYTAVTGATVTKSNPNGTGDKITDRCFYYPWLYKPVSDVVADNVSYQTSNMKLVAGWNTLSTPVQLIAAADTVDELIPSGMTIGYYYDGGWQQITTGYTLSPCDAVYVKMSAATYVQFKFDAGAFTTPSKDLAAGWNLASLAALDSDGMKEAPAVASVYRTAANLPGYGQVVSPSMNATQTDMYGNTGTSWAYAVDQTTGAGTNDMFAGLGYWIYMQNAATLAGFEITPIAPDLD